MQNTPISENSEKIISILGCGWLGLPFAEYLITKKYQVKGSTRSQGKLHNLKNAGIQPFVIDLSVPQTIDSNFFLSEVLVLNIPPGTRRRPIENHLEELQRLFDQMRQSSPKKLIYVSSTSIYADESMEVYEEDADRSSAIYKIEQKISEKCKQLGIALSIVRCGGLMGYGRVACKYYSGRQNLELDNTPVNYIFRDDVIGILTAIIEKNSWGEVYNAVAPQKPLRYEVIENCCARTEYVMPTFAKQPDQMPPFKTVNSRKVKERLNYDFKYPDPLKFPY